MTKFSLTILSVLCCGEANVASKSMSIPQILEKIPENQRKSYSTTYRHLQTMVAKGYVNVGLDDGAASTYWLSSPGEVFFRSQY